MKDIAAVFEIAVSLKSFFVPSEISAVKGELINPVIENFSQKYRISFFSNQPATNDDYDRLKE